MIEPKDITVGCAGCLALILCIAFIPLFLIALKVSLCIALLLGLIVVVIVGVAFFGKFIRRICS